MLTSGHILSCPSCSSSLGICACVAAQSDSPPRLHCTSAVLPAQCRDSSTLLRSHACEKKQGITDSASKDKHAVCTACPQRTKFRWKKRLPRFKTSTLSIQAVRLPIRWSACVCWGGGRGSGVNGVLGLIPGQGKYLVSGVGVFHNDDNYEDMYVTAFQSPRLTDSRGLVLVFLKVGSPDEPWNLD